MVVTMSFLLEQSPDDLRPYCKLRFYDVPISVNSHHCKLDYFPFVFDDQFLDLTH